MPNFQYTSLRHRQGISSSQVKYVSERFDEAIALLGRHPDDLSDENEDQDTQQPPKEDVRDKVTPEHYVHETAGNDDRHSHGRDERLELVVGDDEGGAEGEEGGASAGEAVAFEGVLGDGADLVAGHPVRFLPPDQKAHNPHNSRRNHDAFEKEKITQYNRAAISLAAA